MTTKNKNISPDLPAIYGSLYDYYINNGYKFYKDNGSYHYSYKFHYVFLKPTDTHLGYFTPQNKQDLLAQASQPDNKQIFAVKYPQHGKVLDRKNYELICLDSFSHLLQNNPNHFEYIFKHLSLLTPLNFGMHYNEIFNITLKHHSEKKLLSNILNLPSSSLHLEQFNIKNFYNHIQKLNIDKEAIDKFFLLFIKKRATQLNNPALSSKYRDALIDIYQNDKEKLEPYFSFFPLLEKRFIKKTPVIPFEEDTQHITSIKYNVKEFTKMLCIEQFDQNTYKSASKQFALAIADYYQVNDTQFNIEDNSSSVRLTFFHNNEKLNNDVLRNTLTQYFIFLSDNTIPSHKENILVWLTKFNLEQFLTPKENTIQKNKI